MRLFQLGGTEVRLNPGLFVVLAGAVVFGMLMELTLSFLALTLHEVCHAIVARALGYGVSAVELLPFGGVARLGNRPVSAFNDFMIAAAGPLCSFTIAGAVALCIHYFPDTQLSLHYFLQANIVLAVFNLLPAMPLDGGRMLRAALSRILRPRAAMRIVVWAGVGLGAVLLALAGYLLYLGAINPFLWIMGVFLPLAAMRELREMPEAHLYAMLRRKDALLRGEAVPLHQTAVRAGLSAGAAFRLLSASRYNILTILNDDLSVMGRLDEGELLAGIAKYGRDVPIGEMLGRR